MTKLRWGILGTAHIAETVTAAIAATGTNEVTAVASRDLQKAGSWAKEHGIERAFGSYQEMLTAGGFDVVYNPLPNALHARWTIAALEAGYPVLCEKPIAMNARETRQVQAAARSAGLPVAEAFMYRFHPVFARALELLDAGTIGSLVSIYSVFSFFEDDRSSIVASAKLGGGALMDVGCYCVNLSRLVARTEPLAVCAVQTGEAVDETLMGMLEFPDGVLAQFETSIASTERHGAMICGTTGCLSIPSPWIPGTGDTRIVVQRWEQPDEVIAVPGADTYRMEIEDFERAVRTGQPPRWSLEDALANMKVIDGLFLSARSGAHVRIQAEAEDEEMPGGSL